MLKYTFDMQVGNLLRFIIHQDDIKVEKSYRRH
jgi:hypothetical protein